MTTHPTQLPGPEALCALARATREATTEPLTDDAKPWVVVKGAPDLEWHRRKLKASPGWKRLAEFVKP